MKYRHIANGLVAILLILLSAYEFWTGRLVGRTGLTSLTRESHPMLFWTTTLGLALCGIAFLAYSVAKALSVADRLTAQVDVLGGRIFAAKIYIWAVILVSVFLLLLGSISWMIYGELMYR